MSHYREPASVPMDPEVRQRYERFVPEHVQRAVRAAVLAERERCAKIVEVESAKRNSHAGVLHEAWSLEIAAKIRGGE